MIHDSQEAVLLLLLCNPDKEGGWKEGDVLVGAVREIIQSVLPSLPEDSVGNELILSGLMR